MEFLVNIKVQIPPDISDTRRAELQGAETERGRQLAAEGKMVRLWRIPGRRENYGLWRADSATDLHQALSSLPLFPYMDINVVALAQHPSDPAIKD